MGKKALIPEEKWEGLRKAMEEAAGTRKAPGAPGPLLPAEGETARPGPGKKRGKLGEGKKGKTGKKDKDQDPEETKKKKKRKKKGKKGTSV